MGAKARTAEVVPTTQDYTYVYAQLLHAVAAMPAVNGTIAQVKKN